jgi:orotate phosphoribosyltransferase
MAKARPFGETIDEAFHVIVGLISKGVPVRAACAMAGFSRQSFWEYTQREDIREEVAEAMTVAVDAAECRMAEVIATCAEGGDWHAAAWWLSRRAGWKEPK